MIRRVLLLAGAFLLLSATPALAQYMQPGVQTDSDTVTPGGSIGVAACCYPPGTTVTFSIGGTTLGVAIADANGVAAGTFTVPSNVAAGTAMVTASGMTSGGVLITQTSGALAVGTTSATNARVSGLPATGSGLALPLSAAGAVLVAAGGLLVLGGRRRRAETITRT